MTADRRRKLDLEGAGVIVWGAAAAACWIVGGLCWWGFA